MLGSGGQVNSMKTKALSNLICCRVILRISGAALIGFDACNINPKVAMMISTEVAIASRLGVKVLVLIIVVWSLEFCYRGLLLSTVFRVAIFVAGYNFFCGDAWVTATGLERFTTYQIGVSILSKIQQLILMRPWANFMMDKGDLSIDDCTINDVADHPTIKQLATHDEVPLSTSSELSIQVFVQNEP